MGLSVYRFIGAGRIFEPVTPAQCEHLVITETKWLFDQILWAHRFCAAPNHESLTHDIGGSLIVAVKTNFGLEALTLQVAPVCKDNSHTKLTTFVRGSLS